jgi:hypothetical protein
VASLSRVGPDTFAQESDEQAFFTLHDVSTVSFPALTDSNSPAFWQLLDNGWRVLRVINSSGYSSISQAFRVGGRWTPPAEVKFTKPSNGARWMEAVLPTEDGTLYGYYHNEPASVCKGVNKTAPRIGAARSSDGGLTWEDLGIIFEAPLLSERCSTPNRFFYGGVGDFSVILNQEQTEAYFFFSGYAGGAQGVGVARMLWHHRDQPRENVALWDGHVWRYPSVHRGGLVLFPPSGTIYPAAISWHDPSGAVDAFWGPSVHWNTYLGKYVMLLNRASDWEWKQEGVYAALGTALDDPTTWTAPVRVLSGGSWYPQVLGLEQGVGTDRQSGRRARLFVGGESRHIIVFRNPATQNESTVPTSVP